MLFFSWRRLSQHTHVTSLSGHFILLFKLFQTLHSGVSGDLLTGERLLNGCCFSLLKSWSKPSTSGRTVSATKERRQSGKGFVLLFFKVWIAWRLIAGVEIVFKVLPPSIKEPVWISPNASVSCWVCRREKISVSYGVFHCVMWIRHWMKFVLFVNLRHILTDSLFFFVCGFWRIFAASCLDFITQIWSMIFLKKYLKTPHTSVTLCPRSKLMWAHWSHITLPVSHNDPDSFAVVLWQQVKAIFFAPAANKCITQHKNKEISVIIFPQYFAVFSQQFGLMWK